MNSKRLFVAFLTAVCLVQTAVAIPADPKPRRVRQADGSFVTITVRGDEHGHMAFTADNRPLFLNEATGNYEYATLKSGVICGSGIVAADSGNRKADAKAFLNTQDATAIMQVFSATRKQTAAAKSQAAAIRRQTAAAAVGQSSTVKSQTAAAPKRLLINTFPTIGQPHSLVILVSFSDKDFKLGDDTHNFYTDMLNKEGFTYENGANGSVRDFYVASSNGAFSPTFDVVGPVQLPNSSTYYGANRGGGDDMGRLYEFVYNTFTLADSLVDYSQYDYDHNGYVDNVYIIYAGGGEADGGGASTIWPHSYTYEEFGYGSLMLDGIKMGSYACGNEIRGGSGGQITGIGTFTHEFGHVLGLPDLYDVEYGYATFPPGSYDTMSNGSYNNDMNTPPLFSAFERAELGWADYTELNSTTDTVVVIPDLKDCNMGYRISVKDKPGEFYVLENRQQTGWDAYIPGHGMLMWHIDIDTLAWKNNTVNTVGSHQRVDIVEADGKATSGTTSGDPFPGTANVTRWTVTSWAADTLLTLDDIEETDGTILLTLGGIKLDLATPMVDVRSVEDSTAVVAWSNVPNANRYKLSLYQTNGEEKTVVDGYDGHAFSLSDSITISGLKPDTDYELQLSATRGSYTSDTATAKLHTTPVPFYKYAPQGVVLSDITPNSLNATWQEVEGAETYEVTLSECSFAADATLMGYDFANRGSGMPEGWKYKGSFISSPDFAGLSMPSYRMSRDDDFLTVAYDMTRISSLSFWAKATAYTAGTLTVEAYRDGEWHPIDSLTFEQGSDKNNVGLDLSYDFDPSDSVRIAFKQSSGAVYIDDVMAGCHNTVKTPLEAYDALDTKGASACSFSELESGKTYALTVRARKENTLTWPSAEVTVTLPDDKAGIYTAKQSGSATTTAVYDLSGRRIADGEKLPSGIYIIRKDGKTVKVAKR